MSLDPRDVMAIGPVIPVLVVDDKAHAMPLAAALVAGGIRVLEVTLRTPAAIDAIRAMIEVEGAVVGAGTILCPRDAERAVAAGARFLISPGFTETLAAAARDLAVPLLPGVSSASDIMRGLDHGFSAFKFFPAKTSGGAPAVKALGGPFGGVIFCPTGGITPASAATYLSLPNVACVGGSWLAPAAAVRTGDWGRITALARAAAAFAR